MEGIVNTRQLLMELHQWHRSLSAASSMAEACHMKESRFAGTKSLKLRPWTAMDCPAMRMASRPRMPTRGHGSNGNDFRLGRT